MAQREIGLAAGEPPATRGYPPSVFGLLPRLLERAGTSPEGSITGFFTVLVEGDDMHDPVGDTVRGIVDGHIVLSRELATAGHYPPIDVLESVSRVSNTVCPPAQQALAQDVRETLAVYRRAADLIDIGAYKEGANPKVDRAVRLKPSLDSFLRQTMDDSTPWSESVAALEEIVAAAPSRRSGS
jgi:flagellum-specific ATP synthase